MSDVSNLSPSKNPDNGSGGQRDGKIKKRPITVVHFAETIKGGPATHLNELLHYQVQAYDRVVLVIPEDQTDQIEIGGVEILTFSAEGRGVSGILSLMRFWRDAMKRLPVDVVHLHSSFAGLIGRLYFVRPNHKTIYCARGWSFSIDTALWKRIAYAIVEIILSYRTDRIINISKSESDIARRFHIPMNKCVTIFNGIRDSEWSQITTVKRIELLFVGRFDRQKGLDVLVDAFRDLDHDRYALTLIGGPVLGDTRRVDLPQNVRNLGWMRPEQIRAEMAKATAIVMPSRWEGFGFVAAEALRAGRPVIASAVGGLRDIVVDGETGFLVEPGSKADLIRAISGLGDSDLNRLSGNARRRFESSFTAFRMYEQIDELYIAL